MDFSSTETRATGIRPLGQGHRHRNPTSRALPAQHLEAFEQGLPRGEDVIHHHPGTPGDPSWFPGDEGAGNILGPIGLVQHCLGLGGPPPLEETLDERHSPSGPQFPGEQIRLIVSPISESRGEERNPGDAACVRSGDALCGETRQRPGEGRTSAVLQAMKYVIERWLHPERRSPPPRCVFFDVAIQASFAIFVFSLFKPAGETQGTIGHGAELSPAWTADPALALKFVVATGAQGWECGVDERSREAFGRPSREFGDRQDANPSGGAE